MHWNLYLERLCKQQLLLVAVVSGAIFISLCLEEHGFSSTQSSCCIIYVYIYVLLHYICIQKLKLVPKAAIYLANTVFCKNLQCCFCLGSQGDLQLEFKGLVLTQFVNSPRARLLVLLLSCNQRRQLNWNTSSTYWKSKDRAFPGSVSCRNSPNLFVQNTLAACSHGNVTKFISFSWFIYFSDW